MGLAEKHYNTLIEPDGELSFVPRQPHEDVRTIGQIVLQPSANEGGYCLGGGWHVGPSDEVRGQLCFGDHRDQLAVGGLPPHSVMGPGSP